jgi:hypothetical protein
MTQTNRIFYNYLIIKQENRFLSILFFSVSFFPGRNGEKTDKRSKKSSREIQTHGPPVSV